MNLGGSGGGVCPLCNIAARACADEPMVLTPRIAVLERTVCVLGENQGSRGWCMLVLREHAAHMDELSMEAQQAVFGEVARVARAMRRVLGPVRINYECLGNVQPHLHWHLVPRHTDDPTPKATVWGWTPEQLRGAMSEADRAALAARIGAAL